MPAIRAADHSRPRHLHPVSWVNGSARLGLVLFALLAWPTVSSVDAANPPVTYSRDVAPILQANCVECHRPGGLGVFSFLTYQEV
jgi:mono/diheme cytochrome c family protein